MKPIKNYDGLYSATEDGRIFSHIKNKFLSSGKNGYSNIRLRKTPFKIHRLIAETFIPNPENKPCVNHKNGIKTDNRIENLEWCTYSENSYHALSTGLRIPATGERHPKSKLILDFNTGVFYESIRFASIAKGMNRETIKNGLRKGKSYLNLKYV